MAAAVATSGGQKLLQVGTKIVGVGRNYAIHAKELGNAVPKEPVLFLKPTSSFLDNDGTMEIPHPLESLDHEVELAVVIGQKARDVAEASAVDYVGGYAVALDMTAREIQAFAKVDGEVQRKGSTKDMIFRIPCLISHISSIMTLVEGDIILTGTPPGVGPVEAGQQITAGITGIHDILFKFEKRRGPGSC